MARRSVLSASERKSLLALPKADDDLIQHYSSTESDLSMIRLRRPTVPAAVPWLCAGWRPAGAGYGHARKNAE